jgi:hypothetical protein
MDERVAHYRDVVVILIYDYLWSAADGGRSRRRHRS